MFWKYLLSMFKLAGPSLLTCVVLFGIGNIFAKRRFSNADDSERSLIVASNANEIMNTIFYGIGYVLAFAICLVWDSDIFRWIAAVATGLFAISQAWTFIVSLTGVFANKKGNKAIWLCSTLPQLYASYVWVILTINYFRIFKLL